MLLGTADQRHAAPATAVVTVPSSRLSDLLSALAVPQPWKVRRPRLAPHSCQHNTKSSGRRETFKPKHHRLTPDVHATTPRPASPYVPGCNASGLAAAALSALPAVSTPACPRPMEAVAPATGSASPSSHQCDVFTHIGIQTHASGLVHILITLPAFWECDPSLLLDLGQPVGFLG